MATTADEHTALLAEQAILADAPVAKRRTPLPKVQLAILMMFLLCEPLSSKSIYAYINELVATLPIVGGDEAKVGYYAGMIQSLFYVTEAVFVFHWSSLSDRIGRKPVLMLGVAGLGLSMLWFGLSRTFWGLIISRCFCGLTNGNTGVMKSVLAELSDSTNAPEVFALASVTWAVGMSVGPVIGGAFVRPHDFWPQIFSQPFWSDYPYFLPSLLVAIFCSVTFLSGLVGLRETLPPPDEDNGRSRRMDSEATLTGAEGVESTPATTPTDVTSELVKAPLRAILVRPVIISIGNLGAVNLLDIMFGALQPLFYATPIEYGGLGLSPRQIGVVMGSYGLVICLFQATCFTKMTRFFGMRFIFLTGMTMFLLIFPLFPVMNILARSQGLSTLVWTLVAIQIVCAVIMEPCYVVIFMYINAAAPSSRLLGSTNGLSQVVASSVRAVGPATATSLFALSTSYHILGGYGVFIILTILSALMIPLAACLPKDPEKWEEK